MGYFIIVGLLGVAACVGYLALAMGHKDEKVEEDYRGNPRTVEKGFDTGPLKVLTIIVTAVLFVLITAFYSADTVQTGHVGILKQFGAITGQPTGDSLQFHAPWQSLAEVSVQQEKRTYKMGDLVDTGNVKVDITGGSAVSKDSQPIALFVQVNYRLDKDKVVDLYRETGGQFLPRVLDNAVFQHAKSQTAVFTATEFAANREVIRHNIEEALTQAVKDQGISILGVSLLDVGYSKGLAEAIERTVEAKQKAVAAEAQVKVVQAEAQQKVAAAQGDAQALVTNARAISVSQKLKQRTLTPLLVKEEAIKALNPNVQVIVCPSGTTCIPQAVISTANGGK